MRKSLTIDERIKEKEEKKAAAQSRIETERTKIRQLDNEIAELQQLQIKGLIKELDMPYNEFIKFMRDLKSDTPTAPAESHDTGTTTTE